MQYVGIYDKNGYVAEQIKSMKFWSVRNDFELTEIIHDKNEIFTYLNSHRPNIFLLVEEKKRRIRVRAFKRDHQPVSWGEGHMDRT